MRFSLNVNYQIFVFVYKMNTNTHDCCQTNLFSLIILSNFSNIGLERERITLSGKKRKYEFIYQISYGESIHIIFKFDDDDSIKICNKNY